MCVFEKDGKIEQISSLVMHVFKWIFKINDNHTSFVLKYDQTWPFRWGSSGMFELKRSGGLDGELHQQP